MAVDYKARIIDGVYTSAYPVKDENGNVIRRQEFFGTARAQGRNESDVDYVLYLKGLDLLLRNTARVANGDIKAPAKLAPEVKAQRVAERAAKRSAQKNVLEAAAAKGLTMEQLAALIARQ